MIEIAICDDEEAMLYKLKDKIFNLLRYDMEIGNIDLFSDSKKFTKNYKFKFYDLIFLDVNMPELNGFKVAEILLQENGANIIFVTSVNDYAFDAYIYKPIGFIRKDRMDEDLEKYKKSIISVIKNNSVYYSYTLNNSLIKIKISDICYFDSLRNYLNIHTLDKKTIKIKKTLKSVFEDVNSDNLVQINKSIIVNISHINKIDMNFAYTATDEALPISKTFYEDFKNEFKKDM